MEAGRNPGVIVPVESRQATAHLHAQHADGHAHIGLGGTCDLLVAVGLQRPSRWRLCGCIWMMPRPWGLGGVAKQVVGCEMDCSRKCMHVLGWVQNCGRVAAD